MLIGGIDRGAVFCSASSRISGTVIVAGDNGNRDCGIGVD